MDPSKVDVNVHPAKLEVRFSDESKMFKSVYHAVNETLLKNDLIKKSEKEETNIGVTSSIFGNRSSVEKEIQNNRFNSLLELQRKIKEDLEKTKKDINYNPFNNNETSTEEKTIEESKVEENNTLNNVENIQPNVETTETYGRWQRVFWR